MSMYVRVPDDDNNDQGELEEPFAVYLCAVHAVMGLVYRRFIVCFIVNKTTKYIVYKLPTHTHLHWRYGFDAPDFLGWYLRVWVQTATCQDLEQDLCLKLKLIFNNNQRDA